MSNWAQLVIISFSSAERVARRYSKNQNIFVGFSEMLKKIMVKNWILSKIALSSYLSILCLHILHIFFHIIFLARILKWAQAVKLSLR